MRPGSFTVEILASAEMFGVSEDAIRLLVSQPLDICRDGCYSAAHLDTGIGCEQD